MKDDKSYDLELVKKFKKGSLEAYNELVSRHESKVFNLVLKFTRNQEDAEEVLQDVFITIYRKIDGFQGKSAFSSWMYRIAVNAAFMKLRKRKQYSTVSIEDLAPSTRQKFVDNDAQWSNRTDSLAHRKELSASLQGAIERLPEQYRSVFILRDVDGLSNQEVSEILTLSIPAVKSRLHRSRLMLRKKLSRCYVEFVGHQPPEVQDVENL